MLPTIPPRPPKATTFVPSPDGSLNWGEIAPDAVEATGGVVRSAPIRIKEGDPEFGLNHVPDERMKRINEMGFQDAQSFVEYVAKNHNMIVKQPNGRLGLIVTPGRGVLSNKKAAHNYMVVELRDDGDHYGVTTILPDMTEKYLTSGGKKTLWRRGAVPAN